MYQLKKLWWVSALWAFLSAAPALALAPCGQVVVDDAALLSVAEEQQITRAAEKLVALGAVVRVRTSEDVNQFASLQDAADQVCPTWGGARIVLWVATVSRDVGIYAGPTWSRQIPDRVATRLIDERMMPGLQGGSFAAAFMQPLVALETILKPVPVEAPAPTVTPLPKADVPAAPVVITRSPEANQWSFATVLAVIGGIIVLVVGWLGFSVYTREQRRKDALARAQQAAVILGNQCLEIIGGFNVTKERLEESLVKAGDVLHKNETALFQHHAAALFNEADVANQTFNGHHDPATAGQTLGWYESLQVSLEASKETLDSIVNTLQTLEEDLQKALAEADSMPDRVSAFKAELGVASRRVRTVGEAGFTVEAFEASLRDLASAVPEVEALVAHRRYREAVDRMAEVVKSSDEVVANVEALPKLRSTLSEKHGELSRIFARLPRELQTAAEAVAQLRASCDPACYESIVGNGTEAEAGLDTVEDALGAASKHLEAEAFAEAEKELTAAAETLQNVDQLIDAIMAKKEQIDFAEATVAKELAEAKQSIAQAEAFLTEHDDDTSDAHVRTLEAARSLCVQVEGLLKKKRPHYLDALKQAVKADEMADLVLVKAQSEKELADRQRRRADTLVEAALQELTELRTYIAVHKTDIRESTQLALSRFDPNVLRPVALNDTSGRIRFAETLSQQVAALMRQAKADFSEAEEARERVREAAREAARAAALATRRREEARRPAPEPMSSSGSTRAWGSAAPARSSGAERSWRVATSSPSSGATRSFGFASSGRSTGATKKW